jgi:predicted signal transduction protein with EAL and GGDEF domain
VHGHTAESLLRHADKALYTAKEQGRDRSLLAPKASGTPIQSQPPSVPRGRRAA